MRVAIVALLCAVSSAKAAADLNLREFYVQISGVGPTGGETAAGPAATFFHNTTWSSSFLATSCDWDVSSEQIRAARDLGWSIILTLCRTRPNGRSVGPRSDPRTSNRCSE